MIRKRYCGTAAKAGGNRENKPRPKVMGGPCLLERKIPPIHPGEILLEEFMKPYGLSQNQLGKELNVSPRRINEIVHGRRSVTADTALRLARFFGNSASFWLGLQMDYDLDLAADESAVHIREEVHQMAFA